MDIANERKVAARATEIGNSACGSGFPELRELILSSSPRVRRLAASAIGKLAGIVEADESVPLLIPLLKDTHPQVRQYSAKALGAFGAASKPALPDLRDLYRNPQEKDYVKRTVEAAGKRIREAMRIAEANAFHSCQRCGVRVESDEYARSTTAFQRVFCDRCFDEVFLDRRNFDTKVELSKTIRTSDGSWVQSHGERRIAEWLTANNIVYRYDERFRILNGYAIRPDFYLPEFDVYIEYWGMDTADYKIGMLTKQKLYQQQGKRLVSLHYHEIDDLEPRLQQKLSHYLQPPTTWSEAK